MCSSLLAVRSLWVDGWFCRYGISYRDLEQMMDEREVLDRYTIYRLVQKYAPETEKRLG